MRRYAVMVPVLAVSWALLTADLSPGSLLVGAVIGAAILRLAGDHFPWHPAPGKVLRTVPKALRFLLRFLKALTVANLQVAWIVVQPKLPIRPGIIAFQTRHRTTIGVTQLANSITLTPGTLTMDVSTEGDVLYIHALDISHPDAVREAIRRDLEEYSLGVFP